MAMNVSLRSSGATMATPATKAGGAAKPKGACKTVVTRAQFEEIANALQSNMNAATKKRLADIYPKMLVMAHEARNCRKNRPSATRKCPHDTHQTPLLMLSPSACACALALGFGILWPGPFSMQAIGLNCS